MTQVLKINPGVNKTVENIYHKKRKCIDIMIILFFKVALVADLFLVLQLGYNQTTRT